MATAGASQASAPFSDASAAAADPFTLRGDPFVEAVAAAVRRHMARYDASHDFAHIRRVVGLARHLTAAWERDNATKGQEDQEGLQKVDTRVVVLGALMHDVGDRKYLGVHEDEIGADVRAIVDCLLASSPYADDAGARATAVVLARALLSTQAQAVMQTAAADKTGETGEMDGEVDLCRHVIAVCQNVSWTGETRSPERAAAVAALARRMPELAIVQDADRLDSLGAVGVARCFAYGARLVRGSSSTTASTGRSLEASVDHFDEKLVRVVDRMKTAEGRRLAGERTERLRAFQAWFREEAGFAVEDPLLEVEEEAPL